MMFTKYIDYLIGSENSPQATKFSYTKQYSDQSWPMEYKCEGVVSTSNVEILERFQSEVLHICRCTLVRSEYGYLKGSPKTNS
jgi:hypothetical protein